MCNCNWSGYSLNGVRVTLSHYQSIPCYVMNKISKLAEATPKGMSTEQLKKVMEASKCQGVDYTYTVEKASFHSFWSFRVSLIEI